jgi:hypothetical protein
MSLFKLKPTREKFDEQQVSVVADIDAILTKPVAFRFNGKLHYIKPVSTREYLKVTEIFAKMDSMGANGAPDVSSLVDVYSELFSSLCETISKKDVMEMTQSQIGALLQLVIEHVTGRIEKKKIVTRMPTQSQGN